MRFFPRLNSLIFASWTSNHPYYYTKISTFKNQDKIQIESYLDYMAKYFLPQSTQFYSQGGNEDLIP